MADKSNKFTVIDGSTMEGGGQVLRNTTSLSAILSKPINVIKIRANRPPKPGLRAQHLTGLEIVENLYNGNLTGGFVSSNEITFTPGLPKSGNFTADIGTAGGGTNADKCPPIDYFMHVFTPIAARFGITYEVQCVKRGFFPKGGGEVKLITNPMATLKPIILDSQGDITHIEIRAFTAGALPGNNFGERMIAEAEKALKKHFNSSSITYTTTYDKETNKTAVGSGAGILLIAKTSTGCILAGSAVLERNKRPEELGGFAAKELITNVQHGGALDEYATDQVIIFMALAKGRSSVVTGPLSLHTQTSIHFSQIMTNAKFEVSEVLLPTGKKLFKIVCDGIGFANKYL